MNQAGFSDAELAEFRVLATMHVDQVDGDFVPDLDALQDEQHDHDEHVEEAPFSIAVPEMPEAVLPEEPLPDAEQPPEEEAPVAPDAASAESEADDPDIPQQLSLF